MKNRLFLQFSLLALVIGAFMINGCKDTATDPGYVALAEIRFANYHQVQPIQIYMYPQKATSADSGSKTPTAMTYGKVTPYFNNLPTNRTTGQNYHLVAKIGGTNTIIAEETVTLFPDDKRTWLISGNDGKYDSKIIDDKHPTANDTTHAFFRFLNVDPNNEPGGLSLMIGDPYSGTPLATLQHYQTASAYQPIPIQYTKGNPPLPIDTSVTFYVVNSAGVVLSRLSGVGLSAGSYHTLTWGGATVRIPDPTTGKNVLDDTVRIRILDDDQLGTDQTLTAPLTFRYNIINALVVPVGMVGKSLDYTTYGGLNIVINNNTAYDYQGIQPFNPVPYHGNITGDGVFSSVPATIPLVDVIYVKMVKPFPGAKAPSVLDTNLFRLYAQHPIIKSDQIYSVVVYDTARPYKVNAADNTPPYDSAGGSITVPVPDVPVAGNARIVLLYALAFPYSGSKTSNNPAKFTYDIGAGPILVPKVKSVRNFDSTITVPAGNVTLEATVLETDVKTSFNAESGAIYEAVFVGQRGRPDPNDAYKPRFIIVRVNPK